MPSYLLGPGVPRVEGHWSLPQVPVVARQSVAPLAGVGRREGGREEAVKGWFRMWLLGCSVVKEE